MHYKTKKIISELALSKKENAKSEPRSLNGTDPDPTSRTNYTLRLNFILYRGETLESLKGTYALKNAKDSLAYMAR